VSHQLRLAVLAMLPGDEVALFDGALFAMTAFAFEIEFHALAPALPANRADVSCHFFLPYPFTQVRFTACPAFVPLHNTPPMHTNKHGSGDLFSFACICGAPSNSPFFRRATAVVRNRRDVLDRPPLDSRRRQGAHRRLAAR